MQRGSSIALLILFLIAQVGVSFGTHFCQGEAVKTVVLFGSEQVPGCGMEDHDRNCEQEGAVLSKDCCEDERTTFRNERDQVPSSPARVAPLSLKGKVLHPVFSEKLGPSFDPRSIDRERTPPEASSLSSSRYHSLRFQVFRL